jgi:rhodanese-related sulfurtransferase
VPPAAVRAFARAAVLILLSAGAGALRQAFPDGIHWSGRWPTAETSAEDAYKMMAQPGDPPFASLAQAIALHNGGALFLDARASEEFAEGHIPGARNLPFYELESHEKAALDGVKPGDRIVIYCEGIGCELSLFLGRELRARGFTDLMIFYGGFPEWKNAGLGVEK